MSHYEFEWPIRVYYEDTDAGGIVYYANYLKFIERARTEWLRSLGIEQDTWLAHNIAFVVRKVELDLRQAAKFNAELMVTVKVTKIKKASLVFEQQVLAKDGSVHCQATVLAACIDNQAMKAVAIPEPIISRIQSGV
ncbi:tol-pal system-associated acyl-CoA thioesterase [Idiomarina loihiensis]|jgi:acyl-CoA thioester hydrolase|uniref:tol-pal system-associated acyl-CoA thioesterase n=1 Tax=Idiomarina TaxID=135575 RepID=UPI000D7106EA|nr:MULTISPECIES: tol-pal system-associated acyl-CoA thioesterase [Idiomarina]MBL4857462.1 tol-pal system-associated acyl-CoA thioesterase [Idiomarina sp.]MRJ43454.1 tol-pal system-associated acyl-CoA thioesterase [Idiomarina loihiensis]PWW41653.1 acyl-CoA thioester hydrolase [Idiomarina loihiensis]TDP50711.1 acyl-CoA thioester hydrolase [Idiomarina loihiensis]TDS25011.1 acyl-CoA thioester hydrolase [Idiomarina sp. H2]